MASRAFSAEPALPSRRRRMRFSKLRIRVTIERSVSRDRTWATAASPTRSMRSYPLVASMRMLLVVGSSCSPGRARSVTRRSLTSATGGGGGGVADGDGEAGVGEAGDGGEAEGAAAEGAPDAGGAG